MKRWWPKINETLSMWSFAVIFTAVWQNEVDRADVFLLLLYAVLIQLAVLACCVVQALWAERRRSRQLKALKARILDRIQPRNPT